jgi:competence protein ComEC
MKTVASSVSAAVLVLVLVQSPTPALAGAADKKLDLYWVDVEGGAATLVVTPAGESVLFDTGYPGDRDAERIRKAVIDTAGLKQIDYLVITHFHVDHFGGIPDIVKRLPIGAIYSRDFASAAEGELKDPKAVAFTDAKIKKVVIKPGDKLPLKQVKGAAPLTFQFVGMNEKFVPMKGAKANGADLCKEHQAKGPDKSDNRNSVVTLVTFGPWRFFEGGDLTWNTENALVCPKNNVGAPVDLFQIEHHGLDQSNNPVLIKTLQPNVVIVNNGPKKGGEPGALTTLRAIPSIKAVYQIHRSGKAPAEQNTAPEQIANTEEACAGNFIKVSVDSNGKSYAVAVPATKHEKTYATLAK